jgi:hypothetical protein
MNIGAKKEADVYLKVQSRKHLAIIVESGCLLEEVTWYQPTSSMLAEINYPTTPPSYNSNNTGKYADFPAYYQYYDGLEP